MSQKSKYPGNTHNTQNLKIILKTNEIISCYVLFGSPGVVPTKHNVYFIYLKCCSTVESNDLRNYKLLDHRMYTFVDASKYIG